MLREVKNKKINVEVFQKEGGEKFTNIDWTIQKLYTNYLDIHFPGINFVGEEDTSNKINADENLFKIVENEEINFDLLKNIIDSDEILNEKDVCIFMDPIDSTSSLIKNNFGPVTILVGLALKNLAHFGLVHFPILDNDEKQTATYFNIPKKGIFKYNSDNNEISKIVHNKTDDFTFVCSSSRSNDAMEASNYCLN